MKKFIPVLIIFMTILSCIPLTSADGTRYFPPNGGWMQGVSNLGGSFTNNSDYLSFSLTASTTGYRYWISNTPIDLTNISYLEIDWSGAWGISSDKGNVSFGIATGNDTLFTTLVSRTTTFSRTTQNLSVSNYYGNYYLKFGGNYTVVGLGLPITGTLYGVTAHNASGAWPLDVTSITTTTATLSGYLVNGSNVTCTVGFWYGNETTTQTLVSAGIIQNQSMGSYTEGQTFTHPATGLVAGRYYYVRTWSYNGYNFNISSNESYFLAKPTAPLTLTVSNYGSTSLRVSWTNATLPSGRNQSVYIRYKTGSPPSSLTDGTYGANVSTLDYVVISGLSQETTTYFSAWTYINASGSPSFHIYSDEYISASNTTIGGTYNITVRYENESTVGNLPVNLSKYGPHNFIIHYSDETDYVVFFNGNHTSDVIGYFTSNATGNFTVEVNKTVSYFEFNWNDTTGMDARCNRIIIPTLGQHDITFYIRTNLPIYGETSAYPNQTLVKYTYGFLDVTGLFRYPNNPKVIIYKYNSTGTYILIHSEYFDAVGNVHPWLIYGEKYYIGVSCDLLTIERLGVAPTADDTVPQITIPYQWQITYTFFDLIDVEFGWDVAGVYVHYSDTTSSTLSATLRLYYYYNNTEVIFVGNTTNLIDKNWTIACNISDSYVWEINTTLDDSADLYTGEYTSTKIPIFTGMAAISSVTSLDSLLTIIFGPTPFISSDTGAVVPWSYVLIFGICFILMTTFGRLNALIGALSVGLTLSLAGAAVTGMQTLFTGYAWWQGPVLIVVGFFVIAISIVGLLGGVGQR